MTTTPTIHVQPITGEATHTINCPCCGNLRLIVHDDHIEDAMKVTGKEHFIEDGDTVQGIWSRLSKEQQKREMYSACLEVGTCPQCKGRHFIIEMALVDSFARDGTTEYDDYFQCLLGNVDLRQGGHAVCTLDQPIDGVPGSWLMFENFTDDNKPIQQHWFGPFRLDRPDDVEGSNGVAYHGGDAEPWIFGRDLVVKAWDPLWSLIVERTPEAMRAKPVERMTIETMLRLIGNGIERESDEMIVGLLDKAFRDLRDADDKREERMLTQARGAAITVLGPTTTGSQVTNTGVIDAARNTDSTPISTGQNEITPDFGDLFDSL